MLQPIKQFARIYRYILVIIFVAGNRISNNLNAEFQRENFMIIAYFKNVHENILGLC